MFEYKIIEKSFSVNPDWKVGSQPLDQLKLQETLDRKPRVIVMNTHIELQQIGAVRRSLLHSDHASVAMYVEVRAALLVRG